ncbi:MAG: pyridoxamine 5'-phosphate oxidase family protein [Verrucomicrobia bacterium]|nr:pyridoxamine 5'-phosphate oxidase family protein [Verrucomicrobiota bacterium]
MTSASDRASEFVAALRTNLRTVILGTVSPDGTPDASVAAAILDPNGVLVVCVSGLAAHTRNLTATARTSVLLIEDESAASQPFARRRLTLSCTAAALPRDTADFDATVATFRTRYGALIDLLISLPDFQFFRLQPQRGRLVMGFGQAAEVDPASWQPRTPAAR